MGVVEGTGLGTAVRMRAVVARAADLEADTRIASATTMDETSNHGRATLT